jgi:hypothetical protein
MTRDRHVRSCERRGVRFPPPTHPGRSPHDALDALSVGIGQRKVNWVLDADIRDFLDASSHCSSC